MEEKPFVSSNMISPSSSFKPNFNDQDYMELGCENGQIIAKSRRPGSFQNRRTQSLLDLYEIEYDESFKKHIKNLEDTQVVPVSNDNNDNEQTKKKKIIKSSNIESKSNKRIIESSTLLDDSLKGSKNVGVITSSPPDEQSETVGRSTDSYFSSSSMLSSRDLSCFALKRKYGDMEEEESTYLSNNSDDESGDAKTQRKRKTVTRRKRSTEVHKLSERKKRNEINKRMSALQELLPNCYKDDKISLLDEAIKYMRTLQLQVQMMNMRNGLIRPRTMLPMCHYSPMSLGMHMGAMTTTSIPQFLPMIVQGTGFPGINDASSQMLSLLNQPIGVISNSQIFSPLESCYPQFVMPSCVPQTQTLATSFTQFPKSAPTSDLENAI